MRLRFVLFFFFLLGALAPKVWAELTHPLAQDSGFAGTDPLLVLLDSLPLFPNGASPQPIPRSSPKERRQYYASLMEAQGVLSRKRLMLHSVSLPPLVTAEDPNLYLEMNDFSRYFFQYFANAFSEVTTTVELLESPQLYLSPLLKLALRLYEAAMDASGQSQNPPKSIRRGVPEECLKERVNQWRLMRRELDCLLLTAEGRRVVNCVIRIIQRGINLVQQLNNQRTRREITLEDLGFMEERMGELISMAYLNGR